MASNQSPASPAPWPATAATAPPPADYVPAMPAPASSCSSLFTPEDLHVTKRPGRVTEDATDVPEEVFAEEYAFANDDLE